MFETTARAGVLRMERPGTRWLSTGWDGGHATADAAHTVSVPEDWHSEDVGGYVRNRLDEASFADAGPVLLTGVALRHARGARCGPVEAYATAGVSNPAALPIDPGGGSLPDGHEEAGTVNLVVGTTRALDDAALANLVAVTAEAKAATLLAEVGVPGTTTDAVVVGCDPDGERVAFTGSATPVGAAARACVRDAVRASLDARYGDDDPPASVADAEHGVVTDVRADVFDPQC
jgi:adenosylcobinamide hydrolase